MQGLIIGDSTKWIETDQESVAEIESKEQIGLKVK